MAEEFEPRNDKERMLQRINQRFAEIDLRDAIQGARKLCARKYHKKPLWSFVAEMFGLGSVFSQELCRRYALDPNELVKP